MEQKPTKNPGGWQKKLIVLGVLVGVAAAVYFFFGDQLSIEALAQREAQIREFQSQYPVLIWVAAFSLYVLVTGLSLPFATALTLVYGWFFKAIYGWFTGIAISVVLVSFASTAGATVAFLFSRYLFRDTFQNKFGHRLKAFNDALDREGAFYLFSLRLIAGFPFFVINVVMGLTRIKVSTFWWVSQLGMLPGTIAYVYAGSTFPDLNTLAEKGVASIITWQVLLAFAILGLLPLVLKKTIGLLKNKK